MGATCLQSTVSLVNLYLAFGEPKEYRRQSKLICKKNFKKKDKRTSWIMLIPQGSIIILFRNSGLSLEVEKIAAGKQLTHFQVIFAAAC